MTTLTTNPAPSDQSLPIFLRLPDVQRLLGISRSTVYKNLDRDPTFPRPVRLGERAIGWRRADLIEWADAREPAPAFGE